MQQHGDDRQEDAAMLAAEKPAPGAAPGADSASEAARLRLRGTCAQCVVAGAVFLLSAGCGFPIGFSAVLLPQLRADNSSLPTDEEMGSWIASVHSAATPVGAFASGLLTEKIGRRAALQVTALPFTVGWALVATAGSHATLLAGRVLAGLAVGLSAAPSQVFISEVAEPRVRGALAGTPMVSYSLGILAVYALGSALPWRAVAWLGTALPLLALAALSVLPESPAWLARRGRLQRASSALRWLRGGDGPAAQAELDELLARLRAESAPAGGAAAGPGQLGPRPPAAGCRLFLQPAVLKPFLLVTALNVMQIFSGTYLVIFYAVDLLARTEAPDAPEGDKFLAAVLTAAVRVVFTGVACALLAWTGRRPLGLGSGLASSLAALGLGTALYLRHVGAAAVSPAVVTACLLVYMAANTCGFFVLPLTTIGELLPGRVRGFAGGCIFAAFNLGLFGATKAFPALTAEVGAHGVFWLFGGSSLLGTLIIYLALPETRGRSLAEVEDYFAGSNLLWVTRRKHQSSVAPKV